MHRRPLTSYFVFSMLTTSMHLIVVSACDIATLHRGAYCHQLTIQHRSFFRVCCMRHWHIGGVRAFTTKSEGRARR
jgi:hypothetical protein